jgi:putative ABC transport system ATP-binding protein
MELLKKLNETGKTVVVVTHDINVGKCADRIINIRDGKIVGE